MDLVMRSEVLTDEEYPRKEAGNEHRHPLARSFPLYEGDEGGLTYRCPQLSSVPEASSVYVFARRWGQGVKPLYVGKSRSALRSRIFQQLTTNVRLMNRIRAEGRGSRVFLVGEIVPKPAQNSQQAADIVEKAFIK
jgi:hypothetical protein